VGFNSENVFKVSPSGVTTEIIDSTGDGAGNVLISPLDLTVNVQGDVYVSGRSSANAFQITPSGGIIEIIDFAGDGAGNFFSGARGVAVNAAGVVYVVGSSRDNVFSFTLPGGPPVTCPASAEAACLAVARGKLQYTEKATGKERMKMQWKNIFSATTRDDFGDPATGFTSVALCIYDDLGGLVKGFAVDRTGQLCAGKRCWKAKGIKGYGYQDKDNSTDGISKIGYKSGDAGKGKANAKGKNNVAKGQTALPIGVVSQLTGNTTPTIQMITSDGLCIGATMSEVKKDDGLQYKAQLK